MVLIHRHPQGARVVLRRGRYPLDPGLEGREGTVILLHPTSKDRYGVQLDGESAIRSFDESELEVTARGRTPGDAGAHQGGASSDSA
jgi:hypothetical protein